jgi:nucleoside 2-deoxyribosyltransferase
MATRKRRPQGGGHSRREARSAAVVSGSQPSPARPIAFVLMPFTPLLDQVYLSLIGPALERAGYEPRRADTELHQRSIVQTIIEGIQTADLIVADLTGRNANVFYELGIAHSLGKNVVLIAQSAADIPFDIGAYRTLIYSVEFARTAAFEENLTGELKHVLEAAKKGELLFASPFSDYGVDTTNQQTSQEEVGYLDTLAAFADLVSRMQPLTLRSNELMAELSARQTEALASITGSTAGADPIKTALIGTNRLAEVWSDYVGPFEALIDQELVPLTLEVEKAVVAMAAIGRLSDAQMDVSIVASLTPLAASSHANADKYREVAAMIRRYRGLTRALNRPADRMSSAIERLAAQFERLAMVVLQTVGLTVDDLP